MVIIGICGFQGAGKDTFADYLVKNYEFKKISFASATKDVLSSIFGWDRKLLEGDTLESRKFRETIDTWWAEKLLIKDLTPRKILQLIGTDLFRKHFNENIWIMVVEKKILNLIIDTPQQNIIVSDCRFPNEIDLIKKMGGSIIHISRNLPIWFDKYKNGENVEEVVNLHPSETSWIRENFDFEISNSNDTIDSFHNQIKIFIKKHFNFNN
jgi:hypothetical protein